MYECEYSTPIRTFKKRKRICFLNIMPGLAVFLPSPVRLKIKTMGRPCGFVGLSGHILPTEINWQSWSSRNKGILVVLWIFQRSNTKGDEFYFIFQHSSYSLNFKPASFLFFWIYLLPKDQTQTLNMILITNISV